MKSGSLFFNVTEPLADDESMNIRTSTMVIGVRGTCGWVTDNAAALLEGTVAVTAGEQEVTVNAGEMAVLTEDGTLEVKPLSAAQVPAFVKAELEEDDDLAQAILDDSGIDVLNAPAIDFSDPIRLRDRYTYSRAVGYHVDGTPTGAVTEFFPDEQGRIGRCVGRVGQTSGVEVTTETTYTYNDEGTLQTQNMENGRVYIVTENTADHRKMVRGDMEYIEYYDEQGREIRQENFQLNELVGYMTFSYDAGGKLTRRDSYGSTGTLAYYTLYEYD